MEEVCGSCIDAAQEELAPEGDEAYVMRQMGDMVGDHLCDQTESGGDVQCGCACT